MPHPARLTLHASAASRPHPRPHPRRNPRPHPCPIPAASRLVDGDAAVGERLFEAAGEAGPLRVRRRDVVRVAPTQQGMLPSARHPPGCRDRRGARRTSLSSRRVRTGWARRAPGGRRRGRAAVRAATRRGGRRRGGRRGGTRLGADGGGGESGSDEKPPRHVVRQISANLGRSRAPWHAPPSRARACLRPRPSRSLWARARPVMDVSRARLLPSARLADTRARGVEGPRRGLRRVVVA